MKIVSYLEKISDLDVMANSKVQELIISPTLLSRFGKNNLAEVESLAKKCLAKGISPVLEWDILMVEEIFQNAIQYLKKIDLTLFKAIRLQDPGAVNYVMSHYNHLKIQLIIETGNHNLEGIKQWCKFIGNQLDRVILSSELPYLTIEHYKKNLSTPLELLGLGPVLLFYSPRSLLRPHLSLHEKQNNIEILGDCLESPHKDFTILENSHGSFIFHSKNLSLMNYVEHLKNFGLDFLRIDLRFSPSLDILHDINELIRAFSETKICQIKKRYYKKTIRGFFEVNKSSSVFKRLKNELIQRKDDCYLGDVIDVYRKKYIAIFLKNPNMQLNIHDCIEILTPDGKKKKSVISQMRDSTLTDLKKAEHGQVVFVNHTSGVSIRSAVYLATQNQLPAE